MRLREAKRLRINDRVLYRGMETATKYVGKIAEIVQAGEYAIRADDGQLVFRRFDEIERKESK